MSSLVLLRRNWRALLAAITTLGALGLLWAVRAAPLQPAPFVRVDALSAFFSFALLGGIALAALARPGDRPIGWRTPALALLLLIAWSTTLTPAIAGLYLLFVLLGMGRRPTTGDEPPTTGDEPPTTDDRRPTTDDGGDTGGLAGRARQVWGAIQRGLVSAPNLVAAGALVVGCGALAARGALNYDARTAGAALDSFVFWFVLLAAVIPILDFRFQILDLRAAPQSKIQNLKSKIRYFDLFRFAWLYPIARLYSLGPWNTGWAFATILLGGAVALWAALAALTRPVDRSILAPRSFLGLALAGLALGTGAGIAAGCYGVLAYLVLSLPTLTDDRRPTTDDRRPTTDDQRSEDRSSILDPRSSKAGSRFSVLGSDGPSSLTLPASPLVWLLSGAIPLTTPFVAAWMLVGASVAGGVTLLAGAAWLVVLLSGLTAALAGVEVETDGRSLLVAAGASVALGVGAPLITLALIQPVIEQLQGGLTPYGDVNIWPWVGLATIDAGHTPVTTLPSIAVAAFMLVLSALVYLIARLRGVWAPATAPADAPATDLRALLASLRDEVPWLGALASRPKDEERDVDGQ